MDKDDQIIADHAIPKGDNMRRIKMIQARINKECPEIMQKLLKPNVFLDLVLNVLFNPLMITALWHWNCDFWNPLQCTIFALLSGWCFFNQNGSFHDITHRMPFGPIGSRVLGKFAALYSLGVGEAFYKRHRHHHALTGETQDPKMRRFATYSGGDDKTTRFLSFFLPGYQFVTHQMALKKAVSKFPKIHKQLNPTAKRLEGLATVAAFGAVIWRHGFLGWVIRVWLTLATGAWFDACRMLLEHAAQDKDDEWSQSTFLITGFWIKLFFWGVPQGDLHYYHHVWTKIPNYNLLMYGQELNPYVEKMGVRVYHSFWKLFWQYFFQCKPYGTDFEKESTKKA